MEQRPKVARDIVVLHNMLRSHQGGRRQTTYSSRRHTITTGGPGGTQTSMKPTERLLQSHGGAGWAGQSLRRLRRRTCCHISVLFRTTQIIQELLFNKVFHISSISPKTFPINNTNPSQTQFPKINFITFRLKPRSSFYKVDIPPQHDLALFSEKLTYKVA